MAIQKNLRFTEEMFDKFSELKKKEKIEADIDFIKRMLDCIETIHETVPIEKYEDLQRQYQALLVELGRLQGELNIYKQKALPKKSFFKRLFGID
jgi:hypothetical protein